MFAGWGGDKCNCFIYFLVSYVRPYSINIYTIFYKVILCFVWKSFILYICLLYISLWNAVNDIVVWNGNAMVKYKVPLRYCTVLYVWYGIYGRDAQKKDHIWALCNKSFQNNNLHQDPWALTEANMFWYSCNTSTFKHRTFYFIRTWSPWMIDEEWRCSIHCLSETTKEIDTPPERKRG